VTRNLLDPVRLERATRIYHSNEDAGRALGVSPGSFGRACRRFGIETPHLRQKRERQESRIGLDGAA